MKDCLIRLIGEVRENISLKFRGGRQQVKRLVSVCGTDDLVKLFVVARFKNDFVARSDGHDSIAGLDEVAKWGYKLLDILLGAADDCPPWVLGVQAKKSVVMPKSHKCDGGKLLDFFRRAGPNGGRHWRQIPF